MGKIAFSVDAGIINRLGLELVAKSETAVAELIKNAYDADANIVNLYFENAGEVGGSLTIEDDGTGMTKKQLIDGFMRLATTDKIHNSVSILYNRPKAGRKGIGRFSTQRLGDYLEIITQSTTSKKSIKLTIDWNKYVTDREIGEILNDLKFNLLKREIGPGTTLFINNLREKWSDADIKRVYRYVADLIQPNFLRIGLEGKLVEESKIEGFEVNFLRRNSHKEEWERVADPQIMILDKALAVFSGYINENGDGWYDIKSKQFSFNGKKEYLQDNVKISNAPLELLKKAKVAFKVFYFIGGDRNIYYGITKSELNVILDYLDRNGGVKLYRNGFRVPKYGDAENDWLSIDKNSRIGKGLPFNNNRIFGFVQLVDTKGEVFEESAGREGLIEKSAFYELQDFIATAIKEAFVNFASWFKNTDEYKIFNSENKNAPTHFSIKKNVLDLKEAAKILTNPDATEEEKSKASVQLEMATYQFISDSKAAMNELEMMRVLAGTGLTLSEFVHEIKQIVPATKGYIIDTLKLNLNKSVAVNLSNIFDVLSSLEAYTSYFDETISMNVIRELRPIDIRNVVSLFRKISAPDLKRRNITIQSQFKGPDLISTPMHPSEWNTILQNLYSNAKKAIIRGNVTKGEILIKCTKNFKTLVFEFQDNGTGIPLKYKERIFDAFFTTFKERNDDLGTGAGLGLYILNQMIKNRGGRIFISKPDQGYKTNISIELPLATETQLKKYGY